MGEHQKLQDGGQITAAKNWDSPKPHNCNLNMRPNNYSLMEARLFLQYINNTVSSMCIFIISMAPNLIKQVAMNLAMSNEHSTYEGFNLTARKLSSSAFTKCD